MAPYSAQIQARLLGVATLLAALLLAIPGNASASRVSTAINGLQATGQLDPTLARSAKSSYNAARSLRKRLRGSRQQPLTNQIRTIDRLTRKRRLTADRVRPLFTQLQVNVDWFRANGPARVGTRSRFSGSRIYYQYFSGWGWQFHPLANFGRLNAVWMGNSSAARRALGQYAHELISFAVNRGGALTWEYYFPFSGSSAPFISSISQGTAIQSLARAGAALGDPAINAAAMQAARAFAVRAPTGLRVPMDGGSYFAGYSGNRHEVIFNMFVQALIGMHDYLQLIPDTQAEAVYQQGLVTARAILPKSDTGAWSLYELGGRESNLNYHLLLTGFLKNLCADTAEAEFCDLHARMERYVTEPPTITKVKKRVRRGRLYVSFALSKVSTVTVRSGRRQAVATVGYGKHTFSVARRTIGAVTITAKDLAGNTVQIQK